jgi:hypothetical protein
MVSSRTCPTSSAWIIDKDIATTPTLLAFQLAAKFVLTLIENRLVQSELRL